MGGGGAATKGAGRGGEGVRCVGEAGELTVGAVQGEVAGEHPVVPLVGCRGCGLRVEMVV